MGHSTSSGQLKPSTGFNDRMEEYVSGGYNLQQMIGSDIGYVRSQMTEYNGPLYRLENARYNADILNVGDTFEFGGIRSFSRSRAVVDDMLDGLSDNYAGISKPALFITRGSTRQYNMARHVEGYITDQQESIAEGKFRVLRKRKTMVNGESVTIVEIEQIKK